MSEGHIYVGGLRCINHSVPKLRGYSVAKVDSPRLKGLMPRKVLTRLLTEKQLLTTNGLLMLFNLSKSSEAKRDAESIRILRALLGVSLMYFRFFRCRLIM